MEPDRSSGLLYDGTAQTFSKRTKHGHPSVSATGTRGRWRVLFGQSGASCLRRRGVRFRGSLGMATLFLVAPPGCARCVITLNPRSEAREHHPLQFQHMLPMFPVISAHDVLQLANNSGLSGL